MSLSLLAAIFVGMILVSSLFAVYQFGFGSSSLNQQQQTQQTNGDPFEKELQGLTSSQSTVVSRVSSSPATIQQGPSLTSATSVVGYSPPGLQSSSGEVQLIIAQPVGYNHSYFPSPIVVTLGVNNTMVWTNTDDSWHTVTANDGSFSSGNIWTGNSFEFTFTKPGTYPYFCQYHLWMRGVVIVKA
jgi:plastocyanin